MSSEKRRVTMAQVAQAAGVSPMTVSYTYNEPGRVSAEAAAKVRQAAAQLGYPGPHPGARSLRRGWSGTLGVVLGEHLTYAFEDPQATRFLAGVADVCAEHSIGLTLVPITGDGKDATRVSQAAVDGFVVWTTAEDDPVLEAVVATGLPAVVHGNPSRPGLPSIGIDDQAAARAIGRLAFTAAQRPAILSFPLDRSRRSRILTGPDPQMATFPVTRHRLMGFKQAWEDTGGDWSQVQVAVCTANTAPEAFAAITELVGASDGQEIDAVAAMSDELALGALRALHRAGVAVPDQVAITGWDDTDAAAPMGLTTVHQDLRTQGAHCARIALGQSPGPAPTRWKVVPRRSARTTATLTPPQEDALGTGDGEINPAQ